ncbi:hypothetical protein ACHAPU_007140 [Fusarium lateritium]
MANTCPSLLHRAQALCELSEKRKTSLALLPQRTPEEVYQEKYEAAVILYENALDLACSNKSEQVDPATWRARRNVLFDCELRLRKLEEHREETREEDDRVYKKAFEDYQDACAFDLFDLLGRSGVDDVVKKWRERDVERSSPTQTTAVIPEASSRPNATTQPSASAETNTTPQQNASSQPYIAPSQAAPTRPDTAPQPSASSQMNTTSQVEATSQPVTTSQPNPPPNRTIPTRPDITLRPNRETHPRTPHQAEPRTAEPTTVSHFAPRLEPARRASCSVNTTTQTPAIEPDPHRPEARSNTIVANGSQSAKTIHHTQLTQLTRPTQHVHTNISQVNVSNLQHTSNGQQKRRASFPITNICPVKKRAPSYQKGFHSQGRTIEFDDVYQGGNAEKKYIIVDYLQQWYIVECKKHRMRFLKQTLKAAGRHLNGGKHRLENPGHEGIIRELGTQVLNCNQRLSMINNEVTEREVAIISSPRELAQRPSYEHYAQPDSDARPNAQNCTHNQATRSSNGMSGIDPQPGEVYSAYWKKSKKWFAVLILPWGSFGRFGWNMSFKNTELAKMVPRCYLYNPETTRGTPEWAEDYRPGGPSFANRKYPVHFFDQPEFPGKYSLRWVTASDLKLYDPMDQEIPYRDVVGKFIFEQNAGTWSNPDTRQERMLLDSELTTDPTQANTSTSNDDRPSIHTEPPKGSGETWGSEILISDNDSDDEEMADAPNISHAPYPRKVSEPPQPNISSLAEHPGPTDSQTQPHRLAIGSNSQPHNTTDIPKDIPAVPNSGDAVDLNSLLRADGRGWPPSVDELTSSAEQFQLWGQAWNSAPVAPDFNPIACSADERTANIERISALQPTRSYLP